MARGFVAGESSSDFAAITPSNSVNLKRSTRYIYVGTTGNIACLNEDGTAVTFSNVPVGWHPIRTTRVNSTSTTASNMVAMF